MAAVELAICGETHDVTDGSSWDVGTCWLPAGHGEDHDYQVERPDIVRRPTPLHPPIDSALELDAYLKQRMDALLADCFDPGTVAAIGPERHARALAAYNALGDVWLRISAWVTAERIDAERTAVADRVDAAYKAAGFTGEPDLALVERAMDGDR